jgi:hypothetical protein
MIISCLIAMLLLPAAGILSLRFDRFAGLVHERPLPSEPSGNLKDSNTIAYILGGSQESLVYKIRIVGRLYKLGLIRKVLALRKPGITEYDPAIGRNLTNDEWMLMELEGEGVASEDVDLISAPPSFFGTFGEARAVFRYAGLRGMNRLVLVSSKHHLERVWITFSQFRGDHRCELYTYGSNEKAGIYELLTERLKLFFYKVLLLPAEARIRSFRASRKYYRHPVTGGLQRDVTIIRSVVSRGNVTAGCGAFPSSSAQGPVETEIS